jgi:hypothetical protein
MSLSMHETDGVTLAPARAKNINNSRRIRTRKTNQKSRPSSKSKKDLCGKGAVNIYMYMYNYYTCTGTLDPRTSH